MPARTSDRLLEPSLRREGASMVLQIEFSLVFGKLLCVFAKPVKILANGCPSDVGNPGKKFQAPRALQHFFGGSASPVSVPHGKQHRVVNPGLLMKLDTPGDRLNRHRIVHPNRGLTGYNAGAIRRSPLKHRVGKSGNRRPTQLGREKPFDTGPLHELG